MSYQYIFDKMRGQPSFNKQWRNIVSAFLKEFGDDLADCERDKISKILNYLAEESNKYAPHISSAIFPPMIWTVKQILKKRGPPERVQVNGPHIMTDHCFVRVLERYIGFNVDNAKDRLIKMIKEDDMTHKFVQKDGKYITFLP